jgi:hypothetical protein
MPCNLVECWQSFRGSVCLRITVEEIEEICSFRLFMYYARMSLYGVALFQNAYLKFADFIVVCCEL